MDTPLRKLQTRNDYLRHKLFRKMKRQQKARRELESKAAEKELKKRLRRPKFDEGTDDNRVTITERTSPDGSMIYFTDNGTRLMPINKMDSDDMSNWTWADVDNPSVTYTGVSDIPDQGEIRQGRPVYSGYKKLHQALYRVSNKYYRNPLLGAYARYTDSLDNDTDPLLAIWNQPATQWAAGDIIATKGLKFLRGLKNVNYDKLGEMSLQELDDFFMSNPRLLSKIDPNDKLVKQYDALMRENIIPAFRNQLAKAGKEMTPKIEQLMTRHPEMYMADFGDKSKYGGYAVGSSRFVLNSNKNIDPKKVFSMKAHEEHHNWRDAIGKEYKFYPNMSLLTNPNLGMNSISRAGYTPEEMRLLENAYTFPKVRLSDFNPLKEKGATNAEILAQISLDLGGVTGEELVKSVNTMPKSKLVEYLKTNGYSASYINNISDPKWEKAYREALTKVAGVMTPAMLTKELASKSDKQVSYKRGKNNRQDEIQTKLEEGVVITPDRAYNQYFNSLPLNHWYTPNSEYDMYSYWNLNGRPRDFNQAVRQGMFDYNKYDKSWHAGSLAWKDGVGYFMKPKTHSTVHMETDRYNKGLVYEDDGTVRNETPEEKREFDEFRSKYELTDDPNRPNYYMYKPRHYNRGKNLKMPRFDSGVRGGIPVEYMTEAEAMREVANNMNKAIVLPELVVTPSKKLPMQSDFYEGETNLAANERADSYVNATVGSGDAFTPQGFANGMLGEVFSKLPKSVLNVLAYGRYVSPSYYIDRLGGLSDDQIMGGEGLMFGSGNGLLLDLFATKPVGKILNTTVAGLENIPYRLKIPVNESNYYRTVANPIDAQAAINDANQTGVIRTTNLSSGVPYFSKGQLYGLQNRAFKLEPGGIVIEGTPYNDWQAIIDNGTGHPWQEGSVYEKAYTPVIKFNNGDLLRNSTPTFGFRYWQRGDGPIGKYFYKAKHFNDVDLNAAIINALLLDAVEKTKLMWPKNFNLTEIPYWEFNTTRPSTNIFDDLIKNPEHGLSYLDAGGESTVWTNNGSNTVTKLNTGILNIPDADILRRDVLENNLKNKLPGILPLRYKGIFIDNPRLSYKTITDGNSVTKKIDPSFGSVWEQQKITPGTEVGLLIGNKAYPLTRDMIKQELMNLGYIETETPGIFKVNGIKYRIGDLNSGNVGHDSFGNFRIIDPMLYYNRGKSRIFIKPENRGKFNALKKRTGKTTEELTYSKNPLTRKRAIFAQNAKKWRKK